MYEIFFNFKEKPFKLVPDPNFLFLSNTHEDVLAHLNYAVSQGEGFLEIIGEAGTGKTTICRTFLENLDENIIPAYIINPKLDSIHLLKAINEELGIRNDYSAIRDLVGELNSFLLKKTEEKKKVILLIDEAHNLSIEVLEQLRLLSNLETTRNKLIQIILVGQPEIKKTS